MFRLLLFPPYHLLRSTAPSPSQLSAESRRHGLRMLFALCNSWLPLQDQYEPEDYRPKTPVGPSPGWRRNRSEEHTSELQSRLHLVCRLLLEKKKEELYSAIIEHKAAERDLHLEEQERLAAP